MKKTSSCRREDEAEIFCEELGVSYPSGHRPAPSPEFHVYPGGGVRPSKRGGHKNVMVGNVNAHWSWLLAGGDRGIKPRVEDGETERFLNQFGEYFVRGVLTGGRFIGVVRIDTRSSQSKTEVNAALSGSYGLTMSAALRLTLANALRAANAKVEAFYMFDGGQVRTRLTSNDPVELVSQLYSAMDEWTATVRANPKAYSVTLAPYIIALGPNPPNIIDFEHQRDVLIRCAKLRSQTLDKLNLVDYILDPKHMNEFEIVPPPNGPDLPALQATLAGDLDVIADAASFAINNLKQACDPETFMRTVKNVPGFTLTALPTNLPKHTGIPMPAPELVRIPNWTKSSHIIVPAIAAQANLSTAKQLGLRVRLYRHAQTPAPPERIRSIDPPPGSLVEKGSIVTVHYDSHAYGVSPGISEHLINW